MNYSFSFFLLWLLIPYAGFSQITQQQARPIDSALVLEYLDSGEFHTTNYHGVTFPPGGYWTWDAGCGLYMAIDDYFLAWSHTGMVADTLAACIDTMPCQAYRLFNLETMANTADYKDSVEIWLGSLGIPVNIREVHKRSFHVWPNPMLANKHQTQSFTLTHLKKGIYILLLEINEQLFTTQLIKKN